MVAGPEVPDPGADRLDDPRSLVAEHDGERDALPAAVGGVEAAVADAARHHADRDLTLARGLHLELLDAERLALLEQDRGLHGSVGLPPGRAGAGAWIAAAQSPYRMRGSR